MRIQLSDIQLVPDLLAYLRGHVHVNAASVGPAEIEVSQLGSQDAEGRRLELDLMLQVWKASHGSVEARIID
jgi:hypothetical protein